MALKSLQAKGFNCRSNRLSSWDFCDIHAKAPLSELEAVGYTRDPLAHPA